ncbi:uncharacterized protein LOC131888141 [Tigriopus californicus]|nr:uncharacterized protein LOC131888141 [Tigriopus californicus]
MSSSSRSSLHQALGKSALIQLIERQRKQLSESEKMELSRKVESSCNRFDQKGKGRLSVDDLYNVVRLQNKIDTTKDDIRSLVQDLDMDRDQTISIEDFVYMPILSEAVFAAMDKNKDGLVSKGELKMAQKTMTMKELKEIIDSIDENSDGLLTYEEIKAMSKQAYSKKNSKRSRDQDAKSKSKSKSRSRNRTSRDKSNSK